MASATVVPQKRRVDRTAEVSAGKRKRSDEDLAGAGALLGLAETAVSMQEHSMSIPEPSYVSASQWHHQLGPMPGVDSAYGNQFLSRFASNQELLPRLVSESQRAVMGVSDSKQHLSYLVSRDPPHTSGHVSYGGYPSYAYHDDPPPYQPPTSGYPRYPQSLRTSPPSPSYASSSPSYTSPSPSYASPSYPSPPSMRRGPPSPSSVSSPGYPKRMGGGVAYSPTPRSPSHASSLPPPYSRPDVTLPPPRSIASMGPPPIDQSVQLPPLPPEMMRNADS